MLILRLDANRLSQDGLTLGDETAFVALLSKVCLGARVTTVDGTTEGDLRNQLAVIAARGEHFDFVVTVGHSNESGIRLASDRFVDWKAFARYLEPFAPSRVALIACAAGGRAVADALFGELPKVDRLYASPESVDPNLAALILFLAPYVMAVRKPAADVIVSVKAVALLGMGRRLKEWRRNGPPTGQDIWEDVIAWLLR